jgi:hypothetical protein
MPEAGQFLEGAQGLVTQGIQDLPVVRMAPNGRICPALTILQAPEPIMIWRRDQ